MAAQKSCKSYYVEESGHSLYTCQVLAEQHYANAVAWSQNEQTCQVANYSDCTLQSESAPTTYWASASGVQGIWGVYTKSPTVPASSCLADTLVPNRDDSSSPSNTAGTCPGNTCSDLSTTNKYMTCNQAAERFDHSCAFMQVYADCQECGGCACDAKPHDEQLDGIPYSMRDYVGNCNLQGLKDLKSLEECELAAEIMGLDDTSAHDMPAGYERWVGG